MIFSQLCRRAREGQGIAMFSARQFIGAATTALSFITGAFLLALAAGNARAQGSASVCDAAGEIAVLPSPWAPWKGAPLRVIDRKSTRLNSSHSQISYAVFCLKKKK